MEVVRFVVDFLYKYYLRNRSSCRRISYGTGCDWYGTAEAASFVGIIGVVNGGGVFSGPLFLTGSAAV